MTHDNGAYVKLKHRAELVGTAVPTSTKALVALRTLECADCECEIREGEMFTRGMLVGHGRAHQNLCRFCRPFRVWVRTGEPVYMGAVNAR